MFRVSHLPLHRSPPFVPQRMNGLELQFASKLVGDCIGRRDSCSDLLAIVIRSCAVTRGKAVPDKVDVSSAPESTIVFGAADLLRKAGEWSRAMELLAAAHSHSTSRSVKGDAQRFYSTVQESSPLAASSESSSLLAEDATTTTTATTTNKKKNDQYRDWDAAVTPNRKERGMEALEDSLVRLEESIRAAQKVLRDQERHVYFQAAAGKKGTQQQQEQNQSDSSSMMNKKKKSIDAETQVRIDRKRRTHHADFAVHLGRSLQLASATISIAAAASGSHYQQQQQQQQRGRQQRGLLAKMPYSLRHRFIQLLSSLTDMCSRSHALQVGIADAAASNAVKVANVKQQQQGEGGGRDEDILAESSTVVLSPTKSLSVWRLDPFWPMLSFDVVVARLLLELPDVLRRELSLGDLAGGVARDGDENNQSRFDRQESALSKRDRIEDTLNTVLAVSDVSSSPSSSSIEQQKQLHEKQLKVGRIFFRAALVEPHLATTALRAFQFHSGREVLDSILQCIALFLTEAAVKESAEALQPGRSVVVDDTLEILERVQEASSPNATSLWPFLQKLLEAVQEGDSRALYIKKDRRLASHGFTDDWMKGGPDDLNSNNNSNSHDDNSSSSSSSFTPAAHLDFNAKRFLVVADLVCDLAWQSLSAVVCGKMTINAARTAAMPVVRLVCEVAALLPVLDLTRLLPLIFVAAQGLGISAWEGNLKLPLARFMWFHAEGEADSDGIAELILRILPVSSSFSLSSSSSAAALPSFDWSEGSSPQLEPVRAAPFCRAVFAQLQRQRAAESKNNNNSSVKSTSNKMMKRPTSSPLTSFGAAVISPVPQAAMWERSLRVFAPMIQANGFTPLHQKLALVACADARQWAVGLTLFAHHCRSVPATQASLAILLDFIRESNAKDPGSRAIQLVVEAHIVNNSPQYQPPAQQQQQQRQQWRSASSSSLVDNSSIGRPTPTVMMRLCRLVAGSSFAIREPAPAMRFFSSLAKEGALSNAIDNCGPTSYAPFLNLAATSPHAGWQDAAFVMSMMIQRKRFNDIEQLAPLVKPESQLRSSWCEMLGCFSRASSSSLSSDVSTGRSGQSLPLSRDIAVAMSIALAAAHDERAGRAVIAAASSRSRELMQPTSALRSTLRSICAYNEDALLVLERQLH